MDGEPATLSRFVAAMHKATHEPGNLDVKGLASNLSEVVARDDGIDDNFARELKKLHPAMSKVDQVDGFALRIEGGHDAIVVFGYSEKDYVFIQFNFEISSSLFSSVKRKKERCLENIFDIIHSQYGESKNVEVGLGPKKPDDLIFGDSKTMCTLSEYRNSGILSSTHHISVRILNRKYWNPSPLEMEAFIR
jgi:hypothetical protein